MKGSNWLYLRIAPSRKVEIMLKIPETMEVLLLKA